MKPKNNHDRMYLCPNVKGSGWCSCPVISVKVRQGVADWSIVQLEAQSMDFMSPYGDGLQRLYSILGK